ncbi:MAG: DUF402 domain-containing protein [Anaerolineaceae bacterium]|nr:DUF402 domain-containing protein [Anaerolineaceae bacterium]
MQWQIIKEDEIGNEVWRYEGTLIKDYKNVILMDARFNREDGVFNGMSLCKGDRFIEAYYRMQWFNIFEIYQGETDQLKGWYCNVTYPAYINENEIRYRDLALDILVFADQHYLILDEDEFAELDLPAEIKQKARKSIDDILLLFEKFNFQPLSGWFNKV